MKSTGERIKELREKLGIKQAELGRRIGKGRSSICEWEGNVKEPTIHMIKKLAEVLNTNILYLMCMIDCSEPFVRISSNDKEIVFLNNLPKDKLVQVIDVISN